MQGARLRRLALLGLVVPTAAFLVACGSGDSDENEAYGDDFTAVAQTLNGELIDLGNVLGSSSSPKPIAAALGRAKVALAAASEDFGELDPPDDAAGAQEELLEAIARFEDDVEATRESLRSDSIDKASRAVGEFTVKAQAFAVTLGEIGRRIEDAGVPLGEPAGATAG